MVSVITLAELVVLTVYTFHMENDFSCRVYQLDSSRGSWPLVQVIVYQSTEFLFVSTFNKYIKSNENLQILSISTLENIYIVLT